MRWSIRVARVGGTEVKVHITFLLLLAWLGLVYYFAGGVPAAVDGLLFILLLFGCVLLHEFGHVFAARLFGIATPDITLLPIGGVARLQRMPEKPVQELVVALAGPAVNVLLALLLFPLAETSGEMAAMATLDQPGSNLATRLLAVNVILVLFNMIPAFPMDGGRVLRALLATVLSYLTATRIAARVGQALAFAFGFIGLFYNPLLIFIALFVYMGASQEAEAAEMQAASDTMTVRDAMVTEFLTLPLDARLDRAVDALLRTSQHEFPVVDPMGAVVGILTRDHMIRELKSGGLETPLASVMLQNVRPVHVDGDFREAHLRMRESGCPAVPVVDSMGRLVGLITTENVGELMMIRSALVRE
ncbi:MAG: site-2 protease family protein [Gemmatimonadota bacterium]